MNVAVSPDTAGGEVVAPVVLAEFAEGGAPETPGAVRELGVLGHVEVSLSVELGAVRIPLRKLLELQPGTILELDRSVNAPVDVLVNGRLLARGDVVMVDGQLSVRVTEIVADPERS